MTKFIVPIEMYSDERGGSMLALTWLFQQGRNAGKRTLWKAEIGSFRMNFFSKLRTLDRPVTLALIGAGKFGTMFLAQVLRTPGIHLAGIADLSPDAARTNLKRVGWPDERFGAQSLDDAFARQTTFVCDDWSLLVRDPRIDIVIECTGNPMAAVTHALSAFAHGKHLINVTVEADALCGPYLAKRAREAGVLYSLAYGDQPALAYELVDWARAAGFPVVAAGRGHKWLPMYRESTPDTVWDHWGLTAEQARLGGMNPKMFNAFLDGTKPAIESAASPIPPALMRRTMA